MKPNPGDRVTPYGPNDLDRNRLSLIVGCGLTPLCYPIDVWGAWPSAPGAVVASSSRNRLTFPWGTILLGTACLMPVAVLEADEAGHMSTMLMVPPDMVGQVIYLQALSDSFEDSLTPWHFSQGVRIDIRP